MVKILIVADEAESVVIAGMPAECTINKRYRCGMCSKCTNTVQDEQSACVEKYYSSEVDDIC